MASLPYLSRRSCTVGSGEHGSWSRGSPTFGRKTRRRSKRPKDFRSIIKRHIGEHGVGLNFGVDPPCRWERHGGGAGSTHSLLLAAPHGAAGYLTLDEREELRRCPTGGLLLGVAHQRPYDR